MYYEAMREKFQRGKSLKHIFELKTIKREFDVITNEFCRKNLKSTKIYSKLWKLHLKSLMKASFQKLELFIDFFI
jgi:hypothetical protein